LRVGYVIEVCDRKPISKTKNWVATRLVEKAATV
jgi:small subunit ribosomal protein S17